MDKLTKKQRSECMSHIKGKDTGLEMIFRISVRQLGIRGYRLYPKIIGRPDMYFPKHKIAVFIDGCFWHGCPRCNSIPATNTGFWEKKIEKNRLRDKAVRIELRKLGIQMIRFWGHEIRRNPGRCAKKLCNSLHPKENNASLNKKFALK
jgi:DNA mismatch endonuclease, patch repair protein